MELLNEAVEYCKMGGFIKYTLCQMLASSEFLKEPSVGHFAHLQYCIKVSVEIPGSKTLQGKRRGKIKGNI